MAPRVPPGKGASAGGGVAAGRDGGTQLSNRYADPVGIIGLLCTEAGVGALLVGDDPMLITRAQACPCPTEAGRG